MVIMIIMMNDDVTFFFVVDDGGVSCVSSSSSIKDFFVSQNVPKRRRENEMEYIYIIWTTNAHQLFYLHV